MPWSGLALAIKGISDLRINNQLFQLMTQALTRGSSFHSAGPFHPRGGDMLTSISGSNISLPPWRGRTHSPLQWHQPASQLASLSAGLFACQPTCLSSVFLSACQSSCGPVCFPTRSICGSLSSCRFCLAPILSDWLAVYLPVCLSAWNMTIFLIGLPRLIGSWPRLC